MCRQTGLLDTPLFAITLPTTPSNGELHVAHLPRVERVRIPRAIALVRSQARHYVPFGTATDASTDGLLFRAERVRIDPCTKGPAGLLLQDHGLCLPETPILFVSRA